MTRSLLIVFTGLAGAATGCGGGSSAARNDSSGGGYATVVGVGVSEQLKIEPSGRVFGENFDLLTTPEGYRGMMGGELAFLASSNDDRVVGSRGGSPIDVHLDIDGDAIKASGMMAGRLGRLEIDAAGLRGSCNWCDYQLDRIGPRQFSGQRACRGRVGPAGLEMPPIWLKLPPARQVMLLATLLCL